MHRPMYSHIQNNTSTRTKELKVHLQKVTNKYLMATVHVFQTSLLLTQCGGHFTSIAFPRRRAGHVLSDSSGINGR